MVALNRPIPGGLGRLKLGATVGKVGTVPMTLADLLQTVVALLVLIGITVLAIVGVVTGGDAVTVYGVVLGYAFGLSQGIKAERRDPVNP